MVSNFFMRSFIAISFVMFFSMHGYQLQKLTILTCPIGHAERWSHYGVTRSIRNGLLRIGVAFNYNPSRLEDIGDVVWVLTDINALNQAIHLKRIGKIKKLLAGPNLMVRSNEDNHILANDEIDLCIVPSDWVKKAYIEDENSLKDRIAIWYAGVDTEYWKPTLSNHRTNKQVLVYWKTESEQFCSQVENVLIKHGWIPIRAKYGMYDQSSYKNILSQVAFAVFISRSESQGLALAEAWSMNIPSLVWDPQVALIIRNKLHDPVSAAPYLTDDTGLLWKDIDELDNAVDTIGQNLEVYQPRLWVLNNMSDEIAAHQIIDIIVAI